MDLKAPKPVAELVLPSATRDRTPPFEEWQSFSGVAEGHFLADDLAEVRQRLYADGYTAKVSLTHKCEPRKLTYALPKGKMVIHKEHGDAPEIAAFLRHFSLGAGRALRPLRRRAPDRRRRRRSCEPAA